MNLFLMMAAGYGSLKAIAGLPFLVMLGGYVLLWFFAIYIALYWTERRTRDLARYAVLAPWLFVVVIVVPQGLKEPVAAASFAFFTALLWFMYIPGEAVVRRVRFMRPRRE